MYLQGQAGMIMELPGSTSAIQVQRPEGWRRGDELVLQVTEGHLPAEAPLLREVSLVVFWGSAAG